MKKMITPLIASAIALASANIYAADTYSQEKLKEMVERQDDDCNEKVTFEEYFEDTVTDNSDSLDVNKDGYITAGEVALEMKEDLIDTVKQLQELGVSETDANKTITKELNAIDKESELIVKKMDSDGDNLVEPEELEKYKRKEFDKLDTNRDGVLSKADASKGAFGKKKQLGFGYRYKQSN